MGLDFGADANGERVEGQAFYERTCVAWTERAEEEEADVRWHCLCSDDDDDDRRLRLEFDRPKGEVA